MLGVDLSVTVLVQLTALVRLQCCCMAEMALVTTNKLGRVYEASQVNITVFCRLALYVFFVSRQKFTGFLPGVCCGVDVTCGGYLGACGKRRGV